MTLGDLIRRYRQEQQLSQRQFALRCQLSNGTISFLERGHSPRTQQPITPTLPVLQKLAAGMGLSLEELFRQVEDLPLELGAGLVENLLPLPQTSSIPLLGSIACGEPILAEENILEQVPVPESLKGADFALRCRGDSMSGARIFDGDLVYIRQQPQVDNGQIAAVLIDNEATLKRVYTYPDKLVLSPENPAYAPLVYSGPELENIRILGLAIAFLSSVK